MRRGPVIALGALGVGLLGYLLFSAVFSPSQKDEAGETGSVNPNSAPHTSETSNSNLPDNDPDGERSARDLLNELRQLASRQPVDRKALHQVNSKLLRHQDSAVRAILEVLNEEPDCLIHEEIFRGELDKLIDALSTTSGVSLYLGAFPTIDQSFIRVEHGTATEKGLIGYLGLLSPRIGNRGRPEHVPTVLGLLRQLKSTRTRKATVWILSLLYHRFRDPTILALLQDLLHNEPDKEVRARIAAALAALKDKALVGDFMARLMKLSAGGRAHSFNEAQAAAKGILNALDPQDALLVLEAAIRNAKNDTPSKMAGWAISSKLENSTTRPEMLEYVLNHLNSVADVSAKVMYLYALQGSIPKDPRVMETLSGLAELPLKPNAQGALILAIGRQGTSEDLIRYGETALTTKDPVVLSSTALAYRMKVYLSPEESECTKKMIQYATTGEKHVRLEFIQNMEKLVPDSPDLFGPTLKKLATEDPDPEIRATAQAVLNTQQ